MAEQEKILHGEIYPPWMKTPAEVRAMETAARQAKADRQRTAARSDMADALQYMIMGLARKA